MKIAGLKLGDVIVNILEIEGLFLFFILDYGVGYGKGRAK